MTLRLPAWGSNAVILTYKGWVCCGWCKEVASSQGAWQLTSFQASSWIHPCLCWGRCWRHTWHSELSPKHQCWQNREKMRQGKLGKLCWPLPRWLVLCWTNTAVLFSPCGILSGTKQNSWRGKTNGRGVKGRDKLALVLGSEWCLCGQRGYLGSLSPGPVHPLEAVGCQECCFQMFPRTVQSWWFAWKKALGLQRGVWWETPSSMVWFN